MLQFLGWKLCKASWAGLWRGSRALGSSARTLLVIERYVVVVVIFEAEFVVSASSWQTAC